ncbi:MAG TPA: sulfatase-like hydrolase/transferase [Bacteroidales bacterium]|nr:sulfatase-like hydrolase/transferase [Bacteroidales bacterium]
MEPNKNKGLKIISAYLLKLFVFWMLLFFVHHCFFLVFNYKALAGIPFWHTMLSFWKALRMDVASACYLMLLPLIILCLGITTKHSEKYFAAAKWVNSFLIIFYLVISFAGLGLYANWGTKINSKALSFLIYPREMAGIIFDIYNLLYFVILLVILTLIFLVYRHIFKTPATTNSGWLPSVIFFLIFAGLLFIGARGGLQKYPINKSSCFYSKYNVLNFAALNDFWNFSAMLTRPRIKENPYVFFDKQEAKKTVEELFADKKNSTEYLLKTSRPNIVLIVLESFSADAIACLGGEKGIAPCFDSLAKDGLLFTNAYATGFRTDQGLVALLSGFPAQPRTSIIKNFEKFDKLPNLIKTMGQNGYFTSFYYGGDLSYANTETYLQMAGTEILMGKSDIPHTRSTDWGAYDEDVFAYQLNDLKEMQQPFFSVMLSLTNHEYFVADVEKVFPGKTENDLFHNTAHYTDKCLYNYIQQAKKTSWYSNTLFVITADHAHKHPLEREYNVPERHHIPLLLYGEVLKNDYRGKTFSKATSHVDIAPTLLSQLKINHSEFSWGKNVMNKYAQDFAFYTFDDGFGFVTDSIELIYDQNFKSVVSSKIKIQGCRPEKSLKQGKSLLQLLFQKYIEL